MLKNLISYFGNKYNREIFHLLSKYKSISLSGASNYSSKIFVLSHLLRFYYRTTTVFWVVNNFTEQENIFQAFKIWTDLPVYSLEVEGNPLLDKNIDFRNKIRFLETLSFLSKNNRSKVVIVSYEQVLQTVPSQETIKNQAVYVQRNGTMKILDLFEKLIHAGYQVSSDTHLQKGMYIRRGGVLSIFPVNMDNPVVIEADFEDLGKIVEVDKETLEAISEIQELEIYPVSADFTQSYLTDYLNQNSLIIDDELEVFDEFLFAWEKVFVSRKQEIPSVTFTPFFEENENHLSLQYFSILQYYSVSDFLNDLSTKLEHQWKVIFFTKNYSEMKAIFEEKRVSFLGYDDLLEESGIFLLEIDKEEVYPHAFQNAHEKLFIVTDKELVSLKEGKKAVSSSKVYLDFLTSLRINDYVVHSDHGIGVYQGLEKRTIDGVTREYLRIGYAENDKLFVPIDQADKVNKYIGASDSVPKLTRLGSAEWATVTHKVKKETEKIAQELLQLYAERYKAKGFKYSLDVLDQEKFEKTFPYGETPGQIRAILDVKKDMESDRPMDRLICGDVGFGKTEVAMRASFKAVKSGKQVAVISPITILADQHYHSFKKRMDEFHVRIDMLSRFRTKKQQQAILTKLAKGEIDIVIGTHRLLQDDISFKDLGLIVIDEEQRFGVQQKEKLKGLRKEVDVLTLTATPIPRTLNISLHKIRDITTITTPPPGRLPVITEVRRYSPNLVREVILREIQRGGQIYFLHNRVQTIDSVASKLRSLVPEAKFVVAHGKLSNRELEEAILAFKERQYDVLVSSTIIENGIDLPNANTLIVNNADRFGLAQLYQLRGRVGRGKVQAYAYFLYHHQRLPIDAKKRLRAIVEASELGSGFQIAMKDLEIRGAGDILGVNQHGAINVVGVPHFMRMLNRAIEDLKAGKTAQTEEIPDVSIELPLACYIPDYYIVNSKEKISVYQKLAASDSKEYLDELYVELVEDYGKAPREVSNLFRALELKIFAKKAHLLNIKAENIHDQDDRQIVMTMSNKVKPENIVNMLEHNPKWIISGTKLKIKSKDLGLNWFSDLKDNVKQLSQSVKNRAVVKE
ncbi:transcription-repair coupling factor [Candidatus Peregrinibacteria bacterium]|nr:transcription-repair coupling factor [Candidatus Peregrinibacteria bacterium]